MPFEPSVVWLVIFVLLLVAEAATVVLVSIWFALGALGALLCALIVPDLIWLQILIFIAVSAVALYFTRPIAEKYLNTRSKATNADRVLDMTGVIREPVDNLASQGTVQIGGRLWTARSASDEKIAVGTIVKVARIEGVKLIVAPAAEKEEANV